jgi:hypothetical protein
MEKDDLKGPLMGKCGDDEEIPASQTCLQHKKNLSQTYPRDVPSNGAVIQLIPLVEHGVMLHVRGVGATLRENTPQLSASPTRIAWRPG